MSNNLLLTELVKLGERSRSKCRSRCKPPENASKKKKKKFSRSNSVYHNNKLPKILEALKDRFIEHFIENETKFANLNEIESYIASHNLNKNDRINKKQDSINKKHLYLKELDDMIHKEVTLFLKIDKSKIEKKYRERMKNINEEMYYFKIKLKAMSRITK